MATIYKFVEYAVPQPEQIKPPDDMSWKRLWGPVLPLDEVMPLLQHELAGASTPSAYKLVGLINIYDVRDEEYSLLNTGCIIKLVANGHCGALYVKDLELEDKNLPMLGIVQLLLRDDNSDYPLSQLGTCAQVGYVAQRLSNESPVPSGTAPEYRCVIFSRGNPTQPRLSALYRKLVKKPEGWMAFPLGALKNEPSTMYV